MVSNHTSAADDNERGGGDLFMFLVLSTLIAFAGLTYDAGMIFNAHREATNIAASAARAGANQVTADSLYEAGEAFIDRDEARVAARAWIPTDAQEVDIRFEDGDRQIIVEVSTTHEPKILSMFGAGTYTLTATSTARVTNGAP